MPFVYVAASARTNGSLLTIAPRQYPDSLTPSSSAPWWPGYPRLPRFRVNLIAEAVQQREESIHLGEIGSAPEVVLSDSVSRLLRRLFIVSMHQGVSHIVDCLDGLLASPPRR